VRAAGPGRRARAGQRDRGLLCLQYLAAHFGRRFHGQDGAQPRPHLALLEVEVGPARPGERGEELLELRVARVQRVQLGQEFADLELLADGPVGELAAAGNKFTYGRPQVGPLRLDVLGFLDDSSSVIILRSIS